MRQKFVWGLAPGDKRGMDARTFAMTAEDMAEEIYLFLSGNASTITLPNSLPISKGGTGATSAGLARYNLGLFTDTNGQLAQGGNVIRLYDDRVLPVLASSVNHMTKVDGKYVITGASRYALEGFKIIYPRDDLGNLLCGCELTFDTVADTTTVSVYAINYVNGKAVLDKSALISIPPDRCIDLNIR